MNVISITCPGCGERLSLEMKTCPACRKPVIISSFNGVVGMSAPETNKYISQYKKVLAAEPDNTEINCAAAFCYLNLRLYDKALCAFEKVAENNFDNSEVFFYAAVCLLNGKKAFLAQRKTIDRVLQYIDAANAVEPRGVYYVFSAYIKYDYFARKSFNISPDHSADMQTAKALGVTCADVASLFDLLNTEIPSALEL